MSFSVRCAAALALLVFGLAIAGCGETVIDDVKTEEAAKKDIEDTLHVKIKSVDCPSDQKVEAGETFSCRVVFSDGKQAIETFKIINDDADVRVVGLKQTK